MPTPKTQFEVRLGPMAPPIKRQLHSQGIELTAVESEQLLQERLRESINMLRIHSIATDSEAERMDRKLVKRITKQAKKL